MSTLRNCLDAAPDFLIKEDDAMAITANQLTTLAAEWIGVCEDDRLTETDPKLFAGRQFLNSYCVEYLRTDHEYLRERFEAAHVHLLG